MTYIPPDHGNGKSPKSRSERRFREQLFGEQAGLCWWCGRAMELNQIRVTTYGNAKQNPAFASFEHLIPKSHGGVKGRVNRVLAHAACNNNRPKRKWPHDPVFGPNAKRRWPKGQIGRFDQ